MLSILADNNDEGHLNILLRILQSTIWRDIWLQADIAVHTFESLGLARDVTDLVLWQVCQENEVIQVTANRTQASADSLEATIQQHNMPHSLPVFTLANPERILRDRQFAELVAERLLERLLDIDSYRSTGRLFLP